MPTKVIQGITAWSFSRLNDWRKCPKFAYYKHVLKLKEPGNDAMARGGEIDAMATSFVGSNAKAKLPVELKAFEQEFKALRKVNEHVVTQEEWAFSASWQPTDWFARNAWLRIKTDLHYMNPETGVLLLVDNKTGKQREWHNEQLDLYALGALLRPWKPKAVDVRIWYLDLGVELPEQEKLYTHADLPRLKKYWLKEATPMLKDRSFNEKPSNACNWCTFSKGKGGPCKF